MKIFRRKVLWEKQQTELLSKLYNKYKNEVISWNDLNCIVEEVTMNCGKDISNKLVEKLTTDLKSKRTRLLESTCGNQEPVTEDLINEKNNYCISEYKKYASDNGSDAEILTEDNLDTWALEKVSAENNYDYDDLKNLLLGGK